MCTSTVVPSCPNEGHGNRAHIAPVAVVTPPPTPIDDDDNVDGVDNNTLNPLPPPPSHLRRRLIARLHLPKHAADDASHWLPYFVIFASGVSCSLILMLTMNAFLPGTPSPMLKPPLHNLPSGHFLQVRDEFHVLSPDAAAGSADSHGRKPKPKSTEADQQEALSSLRVALDMRAAGKDDKALRLFKHALALAPRNPDVLTNYGEYLEHCRLDILHADLMYTQALSVQPDHQVAKRNRRRTASIVESLDQVRLAALDAKRDAISAIHESNASLRRAKKEAYFQNIYHSVGIEGNTMTLAQTRSVLETRMAVHGKSIDEHNEILGLDAAMKYINATLVNQNGYITMQDILEVHRRVLGHVDPVEGGELRRTQVYVGGHVPPGPGDLGALMLRFEQWLNSAQAVAMHPVRLAALAHYKLVHIHPFVDGNGRTSRLLMNTILMRSGYPPVIIPKQQRHQYYDYLQLANEGDTRPFVRFVADCTEKTLDLFLWATSELSHQVPLLAQTDEETVPQVRLTADGVGGGDGGDDGSGESDNIVGGSQRQWQWDGKF